MHHKTVWPGFWGLGALPPYLPINLLDWPAAPTQGSSFMLLHICFFHPICSLLPVPASSNYFTLPRPGPVSFNSNYQFWYFHLPPLKWLRLVRGAVGVLFSLLDRITRKPRMQVWLGNSLLITTETWLLKFLYWGALKAGVLRDRNFL